MVRAVIFDWGGVIAKESAGGWFEEFKKLLELGDERAQPLWLRAYEGLNTNKIDFDTFWSRVEIESGRKLPENRNDIWLSGMADKPYKEMMHLVENLQAKGLITAIMSNNVEIVGNELRRLNLFEKFDPVVLSHEVGIAKPDVGIYELMLKKLNISAESCIFIDDRSQNLEPAQRLGMRTVLAGSNIQDNIKQIMNLIGTPGTL